MASCASMQDMTPTHSSARVRVVGWLLVLVLCAHAWANPALVERLPTPPQPQVKMVPKQHCFVPALEQNHEHHHPGCCPDCRCASFTPYAPGMSPVYSLPLPRWKLELSHGPKYPPYKAPPNAPPFGVPPPSYDWKYLPKYKNVPEGGVNVTHVYPVQWSWEAWWECNRDEFLRVQRQGSAQRPDAEARQALRDQAAAVLRQALSSQAPVERSSAAVALGRMKADNAIDAIAELAKEDPHTLVRVHAALALGLMDNREAEDALRSVPMNEEAVMASVLVAAGLMSEVSRVSALELAMGIGLDSAYTPTVAWAAGRHADRHSAVIDAAVESLRRDISPWVAAQTILVLGQSGREKAAPELATFLVDQGNRCQARPWCWLMTVLTLRDRDYNTFVLNIPQPGVGIRKPEEKVNALHVNEYVPYYNAYQLWNPNAGSQTLIPHLGPKDFRFGEERVYLNRLRGSAAIALGRIESAASVQALAAVLTEPRDEYNLVPKQLALVSLGRLGAPQGLPILLEALGRPNRQVVPDPNSPLRGFAAMGLGLYARTRQVGEDAQLAPGADKALEKLVERLTDPEEEDEIRAACAVGLGISGHTAAIPALKQVAEALNLTQPISTANVLLARGMLGDQNLLPQAEAILAIRGEGRVLLRMKRAAVLGLGLAGSESAIPMLLHCWQDDVLLNEEIALSLSLLEAEGLAQTALQELGEQPDAESRAVLMQLIGRLLRGGPVQPFSALTADCNYTMRNDRHRPFLSLANPYLGRVLLQSLEPDWF